MEFSMDAYTQNFLSDWADGNNKTAIEVARAALLNLTQEERVELFAEFCTNCGREGYCQCWNDE